MNVIETLLKEKKSNLDMAEGIVSLISEASLNADQTFNDFKEMANMIAEMLTNMEG